MKISELKIRNMDLRMEYENGEYVAKLGAIILVRSHKNPSEWGMSNGSLGDALRRNISKFITEDDAKKWSEGHKNEVYGLKHQSIIKIMGGDIVTKLIKSSESIIPYSDNGADDLLKGLDFIDLGKRLNNYDVVYLKKLVMYLLTHNDKLLNNVKEEFEEGGFFEGRIV